MLIADIEEFILLTNRNRESHRKCKENLERRQMQEPLEAKEDSLVDYFYRPKCL